MANFLIQSLYLKLVKLITWATKNLGMQLHNTESISETCEAGNMGYKELGMHGRRDWPSTTPLLADGPGAVEKF